MSTRIVQHPSFKIQNVERYEVAVTRAGGYDSTMQSLPLKREDMYPMLMTVLLLKYVSEQVPDF